MTRRKGDSYLGGHTIWPKYYERPDANDLEAQRKRSRQRLLENVLKEMTVRKRIPGKPRKITSRHADSRQQVQLSEIGFGGRFGETVLDALDRLLRERPRWNNEVIANHWNSSGFYTSSGNKWTLALVALARRKLSRSQNPKRRRDIATGRLLRRTLFE